MDFKTSLCCWVGNRRRMRGYSGYNSYNNGPMSGPGYMGNRFNGDRGNMGMRRRRGYDYNTGEWSHQSQLLKQPIRFTSRALNQSMGHWPEPFF